MRGSRPSVLWSCLCRMIDVTVMDVYQFRQSNSGPVEHNGGTRPHPHDLVKRAAAFRYSYHCT